MTNLEDSMNIKTPRPEHSPLAPQPSRIADRAGLRESRETSGSSVSGDTVTITNTAAGMLKLEESLANIPDIDDRRVAAIKTSIAEGSYRVDAEKIANSLLAIEQGIR